MSVRRIYLVTAPSEEWLIEAITPAQAIRHVTKNIYKARIAYQNDLVRLIRAGREVEKAAPEAEPK